jgi:hypothetical protein
MHGVAGESTYTKAVNTLLKNIQGNSHARDSLFEQAEIYFASSEKNKNKLLKLKQAVDYANKEKASSNANIVDKAQEAYVKELRLQQLERIRRLKKVIDVCTNLLELSEGEDWNNTQLNSAKLFGTLLLLSPCKGSNLATAHQRLKHPYKAVLALRLLDKLLKEGHITHPYIVDRHNLEERYFQSEGNLSSFQQQVALPIVIAALFQDIGLQHPKAQSLLKGTDGELSPFRQLNKETRMQLLIINHQYTLEYISDGLGCNVYIGNSKQERARFDENEKKRLTFIRGIIVDTLKQKLGLGNILKIPQMYVSVLFPTKETYDLNNLPKATLALKKAAERGGISNIAFNAFLKIVGHFPQGFGVTYIPKDDEQRDSDRYEYAIVNELNPKDPSKPRCRAATRNLCFTPNGQTLVVDVENNLYFPRTRRKLECIEPSQLTKILEKLYFNIDDRKDGDLIPSHWAPHQYFSYKNYQNLWRKR